MKSCFLNAHAFALLLFLCGCLSKPATEHQSNFARTPAKFLSDINKIAEHGDMSDYQFVGEKLRLKLTPKTTEKIYSLSSGTFMGVAHDLDVAPESAETTLSGGRAIPSYRMFDPVGQHFTRVIVNEEINVEKMCVTASQIALALGEERPIQDPHASSINFKYLFKGKNTIEFILSFDSPKATCANHITFFQNRQ
ncbi:hypothetical protein PQR34_07740 [Paraburkholderia sediminicola]|uniref:hypothetical protein n=2 Tax=Paraburkholderia sediminicola TaxID=458836 RepID=UPI0038B9031A